MSHRFFGKQIEVISRGGSPDPVSFVLDQESHEIQEILLAWQDYDFPKDGRKHRWWQRKHRNYYRLTTSTGRIFELYFDRGTGGKNPNYRRWYVTREFDTQ